MPTLKPFTPEEYRRNVHRTLELSARHRQLVQAGDDEQRQPIRLELQQLDKEYEERLPILPLSRCPYCRKLLLRRFDPYDLNGSWWGLLWHHPNEPPACKHFFVLLGALNLNGHDPVENQSKDGIIPGPEVPYVIPRLLKMDGMVTVVHSIPVSERYVAFPIAYFARHRPPQAENTRPWGRAMYALDDVMWNTRSEYYEFDLKPWIEKKKLLWLDDANPKLPLDQWPSKYPYSGVEGRRYFYRITMGKIQPEFY